MEEITDYKWKQKEKFEFIDFPEEKVNSGDLLMINRLDGIDQLIQIGTGSRIGHSTIAMRKDGKLFICESQMALYFPRLNIQCNSYEDWIKWAKNADYNVIFVPMKEEIRAKFD